MIARNFCVLISLTAVSALNGAELKVDHITIAGRDLAGLRSMLDRVGLPTEYGGKHSNGQTEMALSSFPDGSYLELIAPQPGIDASSHYWGPFMNQQGGPCAWAIRATDIPSEARKLEAAGVSVRATKSGRKRPDGVELRWEAANVGPGAQGSFFPFLIADETKRDLRAYPQGRPTTTAVSGVRFVVVAVRDLPSAIAKYRSAYALSEPAQENDKALGARMAWFKGTPVILAAAAGNDGWLANRIRQFGEAPCAFILGTAGPWSSGAGAESNWFSRKITWLDLGGMKLAVSRDPGGK
jgi:hypothetical protein